MERKFKIGDKVRIVAIKDEVNGRANKYLGRTGYVTGYFEDFHKLDLDGGAFDWYEEELSPAQESIFDKIKSAIVEAAKNNSVMIEPTENGGVVISPIEGKKEDLPIDTPCMCSDNLRQWYLRYYKEGSTTFTEGYKSVNGEALDVDWNYIIEFSKFNPNNIEESLKYNIVK